MKKTRSVWNNMEQATFGAQIKGMLWKWFHVPAFVGTFTGKLTLWLQIFEDYLKITVEMKFTAFKGSKDHRWIVVAVAFSEFFGLGIISIHKVFLCLCSYGVF